MRFLIGWLAMGALLGGEAPLPASSQKLIDDSVAATNKLRDGYQQAVGKEQAKLLTALQKEQEKYTKKGDLDGALAIKAAIEQVKGGLLEQQVDVSKDLLGDGPKPAASKALPADLPPANLTTTCPIAPRAASADEVPAQYAPFIARAFQLTIPKGDPARYAFTCRNPGLVLVSTGPSEHAHGEIWQVLQQAGFKRLDTPERAAWFTLEAAAGAKFTLFDSVTAGMNLTLYAGQIRPAN